MQKILLVEDDPLIYRLYEKTFKLEGFEVEVAEDGHKGLEKLKDFNPNILLLDLMMPNMNGLEVLTKIKQDPTTSALPVVVLTNVADMTVGNMAIAKGAALCIIKSQAEPARVVALVKDVLAKSGQAAMETADPSP